MFWFENVALCEVNIMADFLQDLLNKPILILEIILIIVIAFIVVNIFNRFIVGIAEKRVKVKKGTLAHLKRFFQILIYALAFVVILSVLKVDITAALAGLGVGALVIGFALKDIIENWVSGLLIISGKTYTIGDVIRVGNTTGTVTDIALRTTKLKTYDRNEIIIPNSLMVKEKIINLTSGKQECVVSIILSIDYTSDTEKAKAAVENILKNHKKVVVSARRRREIRFVVRSREWTTEMEILFWINDPPNEEFIKSNITELIKKEFEKEGILPPIPAFMRQEYLKSKKLSSN